MGQRVTIIFNEVRVVEDHYLTASDLVKRCGKSISTWTLANWRHHIAKPLGGMKVVDITAQHLQRLHSSLADRPYEANRVLQFIKAIFNYAEKMKITPRGTNPAYDVVKFREEPRQTILKPSDVQRLLVVLDGFKTRTWSSSYLIKVLLLTGLRRNEWAKARWEWVDLEARTMSLPDTKTGRRMVYLPQAVVDILIDLRRRSRGEWLFPNEHGTGPISHLARQWERIQKSAGLSGIRIHDLRHTVGSLGHRAGLSQRQIADIMGHRNLMTTARYIHDGIDPHEVSDKAAAVMLGQQLH